MVLKNNLTYSTVVFFVSCIFSVGLQIKQSDLSSVAVKRMEKTLAKIWNGHDLQKKRIEIPDSVDMELNFHSQKNAIYSISNGFDTLGMVYTGRVNSCRIGGCTSPFSDEKPTDHEHFDYMIVFEHSSLEIIRIEVLEYQATYGFEICSPGWLKQFVGYSGSTTLDYGDDIQALSGATISGIAITTDVEQVSKYMQSLKDKALI